MNKTNIRRRKHNPHKLPHLKYKLKSTKYTHEDQPLEKIFYLLNITQNNYVVL